MAGIGHFGLPIIREDQALFKISSASERDKLNTALLIGRLFAEFVRFISYILNIQKYLKISKKKFIFIFSGSEITVRIV